MCVAGGKRCEYSDIISNVRKKARSKLKTAGVDFDVERKVRTAVDEFKEQNPELVTSHLPERWGFEYELTPKEIPSHIKEILGGKREAIAGVPEDRKDALFQDLYDRNQEWKASLDDRELGTLSSYAMYSYEYMNLYLRRKGFSAWTKENPMMIRGGGDDHTVKAFVNDIVKKRISQLDTAMKKVPVKDEPQKLYRYFKVPAGVKPEDFAKKYFQEGSGFKEKAFMSTSADPEYVAAHIMDSSKGGKVNKNFVVLEMISARGGSLQPTPRSESGRIQSYEAEVLLPRSAVFQVVDTVKKKISFGKDRTDLERRMKGSNGSIHDFSAGKGISVPIIRMVDTDLL
jgi:hypothetical protein